MKRKLFVISLVLALLVSAYTAYACLSTRGLRVYLMGTQMGAVFAGTWQFTLLTAVILWIPVAIVLIRKVQGLRRRGPAPVESQIPTEIMADEEDPEATKLLELQGSAEEATELLEPQKSAKKEAELPKPVRDVTDAVFAETPVKRAAAPVQGEPSQRFCPNCGHPVSGKKFCARCGAKVGE